MDAEATKAIYEKFYGNYNYQGYISKFISKRIFEYSITKLALSKLKEHIYHECNIDPELVFTALTDNVKELDFSVRDIVRVLDNFTDSYRKEVVKITNNIQFLSDTPLVKLIAILSRLGVNRQQNVQIIKRITPDRDIVRLLGYFVLDESTFAGDFSILYNRQLYQIEFNPNIDGKLNIRDIYPMSKILSRGFNREEINLDYIITKALKYIN